MNDNELKDAFRALADQDARGVAPFTRSRIDARRPAVRARRRRRMWYTASGALAVAAVLTFALMPRQELLDLDLSGTTWTSPTDFLLDTPGSSLLRTVPTIGVIMTSRRPAPSSSSDTSQRDK